MLKIQVFKKLSQKMHNFVLNVDLSLSLQSKSVVFFGPSGSGKTLTIQCIAGIITPDSGMIKFNDKFLYSSSLKINIKTYKRHIGYMPQDYALFPHYTLLENIAYSKTGITGRIIPGDLKEKAVTIIEKFGLDGLQNNKPGALSGGQKQRCALARALFSGPDILLLDEPFSALDPLLRRRMREEMKTILLKSAIPAIFISHDPEDVDIFADTLVIFNHGNAMKIDDYYKIRQNFADTDSCLEYLIRNVT